MADFSPPFANTGERRPPIPAEVAAGFPCGPADQALFNFLIWAAQAEIGHVIDFAAITPDEADVTTLRRAIEAIIAAATGGGPTADYFLISQARLRVPFYPDCLSADGKFTVTAPSTGTIRVAAGTNFQHRGVYPMVTVLTDILTDPSKTYHLRCAMATNTWSLKDLSAPAYNPGVLAETDPSFDSTYDDMLAARITTNASNIATIKTLVNKVKLSDIQNIVGVPIAFNGLNGASFSLTSTALDWARTPKCLWAPRSWNINQTIIGGIGYVQDFDLSCLPVTTRYNTVANPFVLDHANGVAFTVHSGA